jgi:hypothetical protein
MVSRKRAASGAKPEAPCKAQAEIRGVGGAWPFDFLTEERWGRLQPNTPEATESLAAFRALERQAVAEAGHEGNPLAHALIDYRLMVLLLVGEISILELELEAFKKLDLSSVSSVDDLAAKMRLFKEAFPIQVDAIHRAAEHWIPRRVASRGAVASNASRDTKIPRGINVAAELDRLKANGDTEFDAKSRLRQRWKVTSQALNRRIKADRAKMT